MLVGDRGISAWSALASQPGKLNLAVNLYCSGLHLVMNRLRTGPQ